MNGAPRERRQATLLLFISGCCALILQVAWLRELRLIFGASTYASSAVLAIFMGGLGFGGALLGGVAERSGRPLRLYGLLEVGVAAGAAASPFLLALVRAVYLAAGGSSVLGLAPALGLRLVLAALVLGLPTFLMGGTLPAAAKTVTGAADRRHLALIYGVNTLGAVCGAMLATFVLLEQAGTRLTILGAAAVNAGVGAWALVASRRAALHAREARTTMPDEGPPSGGDSGDSPGVAPVSLRAFVYAAAGVVGFVFFLMELVWYRMLSPLLGGTTFAFGLILAVVLFGIGLGGLAAFVAGGRWRPSLGLFAATCALESLGVALAYGLGDRIALLAAALRPPVAAGLWAHLPGWLAVTAVVALPPALVSGFQFPLLVALLGRGSRQVGRHTGAAYAWNTGGAIAGAIAGGFGLVPALGATGCWRLAVALLAATCGLAVARSLAEGGKGAFLAVPAAFALGAVVLLGATGPTAAWRHSQIGVHGSRPGGSSANETRHWVNEQRFDVIAEWEGVESSVALNRRDGLAFVVNGKVDGNAVADAGTQIMAGLIGAVLHPEPKRALVIGLGTGSSAGWLGAVPSIERVDVAELEPAILEVARRCEPVNHGALTNPKVRVLRGDGRELIMTARATYDVIASEPSNPYRAGIASLYTREFYGAVAERLAPGGIFAQWVQAYDIDGETLDLVRATLTAVFPDVQAWRSASGDLLFTCATAPPVLSVPRLRERLASEPFRSAMLAAWGVTGLEGLLGTYVAGDAFVRGGLADAPLNTDDRMLAEFGFARGLFGNEVVMDRFRLAARAAGSHRPVVSGGEVDWDRVEADRALVQVWWNELELHLPAGSVAETAYRAFKSGKNGTVVALWESGQWRIAQPLEALLLADALSALRDTRAGAWIDEVRRTWPAAADTLEAHRLADAGDLAGSARVLAETLRRMRVDPWLPELTTSTALRLAEHLGTTTAALAPEVFALLQEPFSVRVRDGDRIDALLKISRQLGPEHCVRAIAQLEPNVYWREAFLRYRLDCYERAGHALARRAKVDLEAFLRAE